MTTERTLIVTDKLDIIYSGESDDSPGFEFGKTRQDAEDKLRKLSQKNDHLHYYRIRINDKEWNVRYWQIRKEDRRPPPGPILVSAEILEDLTPEPANPDDQPRLSLSDISTITGSFITPDECKLPLEYLIHAAISVYWQQVDEVGIKRASVLGAQPITYRGHRYTSES